MHCNCLFSAPCNVLGATILSCYSENVLLLPHNEMALENSTAIPPATWGGHMNETQGWTTELYVTHIQQHSTAYDVAHSQAEWHILAKDRQFGVMTFDRVT